MKYREQYFFRFLKRGSIFLLVFCLVGCGASGSDRSAERKAEEQKTEVRLESQGIVDIPNYYHKGNLFLPQADGKVREYRLTCLIRTRDILWWHIKAVQIN